MTLLSVNLPSFLSNQKTDAFNGKRSVPATRAENENWSPMQIVQFNQAQTLEKVRFPKGCVFTL